MTQDTPEFLTCRSHADLGIDDIPTDPVLIRAMRDALILLTHVYCQGEVAGGFRDTPVNNPANLIGSIAYWPETGSFVILAAPILWEDGVHDDTPALQALINGRYVYRSDGSIVMPASDVVLVLPASGSQRDTPT